MGSLLKYFRFFRGRGAGAAPPAGSDFDRLVSSALRHPESADPDTAAQWARLERSITEEGAAAEPAGAGEGRAGRMPLRLQPGLIPRIALGLTVIAAVALLVILQIPASEPRHVTTARGEQTVVTLPDNSEVVLNHTSSLDFDASGFADERLVRLTGEAFFKVRKGALPFNVATRAGTVTVTGTKFNVRVRGEQYEVGVTEGSVRAVVPVSGGDTVIALAAGQAVSGRREGQIPSVRTIQRADYPGWTEHVLIFTRMDLWTVCQEVMDYFNIRISLQDPSLGTLSVTGAFDAHDARNVVLSICLLTGRNFRYEGGEYILY